MTSVADKVDAIYCIVHQVYELDRVHRVIDHLLNRMPSYPRERIKICAPTWGTTLTREDCMMVYDPWQRRQGWPSFTWKNRCMIKGEISLILNFYAAMKDALKEEGDEDSDDDDDAPKRSKSDEDDDDAPKKSARGSKKK